MNRIVNHSGKELSKAYANNQYGLVEYEQSQFGIFINYKGSDMERHKESITFGQLYEIMEYVVTTDDFVSADQEEHFKQMWDTTPLDKKNPIYQDFERRINESTLLDTKNERKLDFHYNLWDLPKGGAKTRYQCNVKAIQTLKQIEEQNRSATVEEQNVLSYYAGWGGIAEAFDKSNDSWGRKYQEKIHYLNKVDLT